MVSPSRVTIAGKISQGGYGTVYRGLLLPPEASSEAAAAAAAAALPASGSDANPRRDGRPVAVKEMKGELRVRLQELLKEATVMAALRHPNICTFIGVCANAAERKHYIISELLDCSLFDVIHQPHKLKWQGELTPAIAIHVGQGICDGTAYLHRLSLVHADLKSSNVLIDYTSSRQLIPRICDFGHAAVRAVPSPHHRCGTPHWAAPEVLRGEALGPPADIFSLGVILWEMLTQQLPHRGLSFSQVLAAVGWAGWVPDMELLPEGLPVQLRRLLNGCLSFTPTGRPRAHDVLHKLRRIPRRARLRALRELAAFLP